MGWVVALLVVVVLALGALCGGLWLQVHELRTRIGVVRDDELEAIVVHVRNHDDLAAARNPWARGISLVSPALVRSLVHKEVVRELRERLAEQGVEADVRLRRVVERERSQDE